MQKSVILGLKVITAQSLSLIVKSYTFFVNIDVYT